MSLGHESEWNAVGTSSEHKKCGICGVPSGAAKNPHMSNGADTLCTTHFNRAKKQGEIAMKKSEPHESIQKANEALEEWAQPLGKAEPGQAPKYNLPKTADEASSQAHAASKRVSLLSEDEDDAERQFAHTVAHGKHMYAAGMHAAAGNHAKASAHVHIAQTNHSENLEDSEQDSPVKTVPFKRG